jgi:hypothetical protein
MPLLRALAAVLVLATVWPGAAAADDATGLVVDQSGSIVPAAAVTLVRGETVVGETRTGSDGSFVLAGPLPGDVVVVALQGFETVRVAAGRDLRIVLRIAAAATTVDAIASTEGPAAVGAPGVGGRMTREMMQRMPAARHNVRASLPLLPSVVRGPDGLLRVGGARAHETPLFLDGLDVTDPATGLSSIDPPLESVHEVQVLRDPMAVTLGSFVGGVVAIESRMGGDQFEAGLEGFVPRPRLTRQGFGTLEGFSPRAHLGGAARGKTVRYFASAEYDYDRIAVPEVTTRPGDPELRVTGGTAFGRIDLQLSAHHNLTLEGLWFPSRTSGLGLSPLRSAAASPRLAATDALAFVTDRYVLGEATTLVVRAGLSAHSMTLSPAASGPALFTSEGWSQNSFARVERRATRSTASVAWERHSGPVDNAHDSSVTIGADDSRLTGTVAEGAAEVRDEAGRVVRTVISGPEKAIAASDFLAGIAVRDVWRRGERLQIDAGARLDHAQIGGGWRPSVRTAFRYALDASGRTRIDGGLGTFVGRLPLDAAAFGDHPVRVDSTYDAASQRLLAAATLTPALGRLEPPRALAATLQISRQVGAGVDLLLSGTRRISSHLPTLSVPPLGADGLRSGPLLVASTGHARYWEIQATGRLKWGDANQVFLSYVRSGSRGELNEFGTLFHSTDTPLLQPSVTAPLEANVPHRVLAWGTVRLPLGLTVSPALEWRSGFPYWVLDPRGFMVDPARPRSYPHFLSLDAAISDTFRIKSRRVRLELQLFNVTGHFNPRDVYAVAGSSRFGGLANSVGLVTRGDIAIDW